jgi:hypothetical protein
VLPSASLVAAPSDPLALWQQAGARAGRRRRARGARARGGRPPPTAHCGSAAIIGVRAV